MSASEAPSPLTVHLDHVELFVPDRYAAARWYAETLGLEIIARYEMWAEDPRGPLMISGDGGQGKLALFTGEPQGERQTAGFHRVAFGVDAQGFVAFLQHAATVGLRDAKGEAITRRSVSDHGGSYSLYFDDPYGHHLEVTTYDVEEVAKLL